MSICHLFQFTHFFFIFPLSYKNKRWQHKTSYLASSNLQSYPIELKGLRTQSYLTAWCWNLLGLSFFINGLVLSLLIPIDDIHTTTNDDSYLYYYSGKHGHYAYPSSFFSRSLLHMSPICFEIAAPMSMLVSAVIKYAIWPRLFQKGGPTKTTDLKRFTNLMSHNMNVIFVFIEVGFLGNLSVDIKHIFVAPIFGMTYALYSYCMASRWTPGNGAQFLYFFLDTTLGLTSTKALFGLFLVLILFYVIFWAICEMIFSYTRRLLLRAVIVFVISRFFCKFRD